EKIIVSRSRTCKPPQMCCDEDLLAKIGLTAERVKAALPDRVREEEAPLRYLYAEEQKEVIFRLRRYHLLIVAMALRSVPSATIAAAMGVSRQCITKRLSLLKLTKRGRPPEK